MENSEQFVLSAIGLALAVKKLVESNYYDESKHKLVQDFTRLKNRVQLLTKILENREKAEKFQQQQRTLP